MNLIKKFFGISNKKDHSKDKNKDRTFRFKEPKIEEINKKYIPDNVFLPKDTVDKYSINTQKRLKKLDMHYNGMQNENETNIQDNVNSLLRSGNYEFVKGFVDRWGEDYTKQSLKILKKRLKNKGFIINNKDLTPLLIHIKKFEDRKAESKSKLEYMSNPLNSPDVVDVMPYMENLLGGGKYPKYIPLLKKYLMEEKRIDQKRADLIINKYMENRKKEFEDISIPKTNIPVSNIDSLSGFEFENFLSRLFLEMGYKVESTKSTGDQGADLIIMKSSEKIAVQAKRYDGKVSNRAVQEVVASIAHYGANKGMVVTNSQFTKSAIELAKSNQIQLIDGNELNSLINEYLV